jgi:hypothetical protein
MNRALLRQSALLLFAGVLITLIAGILHPGREIPNDHAAAFAEYASDSWWTVTHLGQFVGMAFLVAGLIALYYTLDLPIDVPRISLRLGAISAVIALALYGVLQAVDGVALKQAVDAWAAAPEAEKVAYFASAEAIRWLEWAVRSYHSFMLGLSLLLFAIAITRSNNLPSAIGYLFALSGFAYLVQGWVLGTEGFSDNNTLPTLLGYISIAAWSIWLLIVAWRMKEPMTS